MLARLLATLALAAAAHATPLQQFREAIDIPYSLDLPDLDVTWDTASDSARSLAQRDYWAYDDRRAEAARRHQKFLRHLTGHPIALTDYGARADSLQIHRIDLTPRQWLAAVSAPGAPYQSSYRSWLPLRGNAAAAAAIEALKQLRAAAHAAPSTPAMQSFRRRCDQASSALAAIAAQRPPSAEDLAALRQLLQ